MADDVFVIDVDLDKLEEALKISEKIKENLGYLNMTGEELINNAAGNGKGKGKNGKQTNKKEKEATGDKVNKELEKGNKLLNTRDKILGMINKKLNLMRLVGSGLGKLAMGGLAMAGGAMLGAAAGGIGLAGAGIVSGINSMKGSNAMGMQAKNVGLDSKQSQAMSYTGKMMGLGEGTLMQSIQGLTTSLQDFDKWDSFASLSLSPTKLQGENPMDALFEVLDAMKKSGLNQDMKKQILDDIGIPFDQFKFVLEEGTGDLRKYFAEGKNIFGGTDSKALQIGEKAMIKFNTVLSSISQEIGAVIAPTLTKALNGLIPIVQKVGDMFTGLLDTLLNSDIAKTIGDTFKNMFSSGKELFSSMFEGFSIDTEGWKETIGGFFSSYGEQFSQMFDSLKPMFQNLGQKITEIWNVLEPDLMNFIDWFKEKIMPTMMSIGGKVLNFLGNTLTSVMDYFLRFYKTIKPYLQGIGSLFATVYGKINDVLESLGFTNEGGNKGIIGSILDAISDKLPTFEGAINLATTAVKTFEAILEKFDLEFLTKKFKEVMLDIDIGLNNFLKGINDWIKEKIGWDLELGGKYKQVGEYIYQKDKTGDYYPMNTIGELLKDDIRFAADEKGIPYKPHVMPELANRTDIKTVNDGIITDDGKIVKTNPRDYIIATTSPEKLVAGGNNNNYTITINANVRNDSDIQKMKNELRRLIDMLNSKAR